MNGTITVNGIRVSLGKTVDKKTLLRYRTNIMAAVGSKPRNIYDTVNQPLEDELWAVDVEICKAVS